MDSHGNEILHKEIIEVIMKEKTAVETGNATLYLSIIAPEALFLPPNSFPKGGEVLRNWLRDFVENFEIVWNKFESIELVAPGDFAYHVFHYSWSVTPRQGGQTINGQGKGMHILGKQNDGTWKITREIWNANPSEE